MFFFSIFLPFYLIKTDYLNNLLSDFLKNTLFRIRISFYLFRIMYIRSLADSLPRRSKLPGDSGRSENISQHPMPNSRNSKIGSSLSRSLSNLAVVDDGKKPSKSFLSNGIRRKEYSVSSLSLANIPGTYLERKNKIYI